MNNLKKILSDYDFKIKSIKIIGKIIIVDTDKGEFVYKENINNYSWYEYLKTRNFYNFPNCLNNKNTKYELRDYIKEKIISKNQKINDLILVVANLHRKTSFYKEINVDDLKKMYENMQKEADYLMNYYSDLNNYIDNIVFMSPSEYLLVSNIDLFYYLISYLKVESTNWYNHMKNKKTIRYSMIHNNLSINHFISGDENILINFEKAKLDYPVKDLSKMYEEIYEDLNLEEFLNIYEKNNKLDYDEVLFLLLNLSMIKKVELSIDTYSDCYNLSKYLVYLKKIASLIQKNEKKKEKV